MTDKYKKIVDEINASPYMVALALAGGGQSFIQNFMQYPGASGTIADIRVPYGKEAFEELCGQPVTKFVSEESARLLATKSYLNCCKAVDPEYAIGIGLTCSLATDPEREGRVHKVVLAVHCAEFTGLYLCDIKQGLTREQEERFCADLVMNWLLFAATGDDSDIGLDYENIVIDHIIDVDGEMVYSKLTDVSKIEDDTLIVISGSFNPFHDGHKAMAEYAERISGKKPYMELTTINADKGILDDIEVKKRLTTIQGYDTIVTSSRTFLDKARLLARDERLIIFVVGSDTWNRILDPKYAGDMETLMNEFSKLNVKFCVLNREGHYPKYDKYMHNLTFWTDDWQGVNISSTEIRNGN